MGALLSVQLGTKMHLLANTPHDVWHFLLRKCRMAIKHEVLFIPCEYSYAVVDYSRTIVT